MALQQSREIAAMITLAPGFPSSRNLQTMILPIQVI
jgi:hypothetical protein